MNVMPDPLGQYIPGHLPNLVPLLLRSKLQASGSDVVRERGNWCSWRLCYLQCTTLVSIAPSRGVTVAHTADAPSVPALLEHLGTAWA